MTRRQLLAAFALALGGTIGLVEVASGEVMEIGGRRVIAKPIQMRVERRITATLQPR